MHNNHHYLPIIRLLFITSKIQLYYYSRSCMDADCNPCLSEPCQNNAKCENLNYIDYRCVCPNGLEGKTCDVGK